MPPRICGNVEPADPRSVGSWKDVAGGIGDFFAESADVAEFATEPWCWSGTNPDCGGTQDSYQELVEGFGADPDSDVYQGTKTVMDVGSVFAGGFGIGKFALKQLFKKEMKNKGRGKSQAPGCSRCFLAGTDVQMADGSTKNIEDIEIGDEVLATDPETGETGSRKVSQLIVTEDDKFFNELTVETEHGDERLTATHEHPFWSVTGKRWVPAAALTPGTVLRTDDGTVAEVRANAPFSRKARTYNLTVDGLHTFYVVLGQTGVLVHNSDGPASIPQVDNQGLQHIVNSLYKGIGNERLVGDGTAMAAANAEVNGSANVEGRSHVSSTTQYRSALNKFLTEDTKRAKGGKRVPIIKSAKDIEVANSLVSAIDDALAGKYTGASNYPGLGNC